MQSTREDRPVFSIPAAICCHDRRIVQRSFPSRIRSSFLTFLDSFHSEKTDPKTKVCPPVRRRELPLLVELRLKFTRAILLIWRGELAINAQERRTRQTCVDLEGLPAWRYPQDPSMPSMHLREPDIE
jgi:hypothetical protein